MKTELINYDHDQVVRRTNGFKSKFDKYDNACELIRQLFIIFTVIGMACAFTSILFSISVLTVIALFGYLGVIVLLISIKTILYNVYYK